MRTLFKIMAALAVVGAIFGLVSCGQDVGRGSVAFTFEDVEARSILPPVDLVVVEYVVSGLGPGGATFGPVTLTGDTEVADFLPGSWSFTVVGRNAAQVAIGAGSGATEVVIGQTAALSITVAEYESPDGSFDLTLTWEPDIVNDPVWTGTLKDAAAVVTPLVFVADLPNTTATTGVDPLHVGWFTLVTQLWDAPTGIDGSEVLSTGAAVAVRIAAGYETSATLDLHAVQGFGSIDFDFSLDFHDPLILTPNIPFGPVEVYVGTDVAFDVTADETATDFYYLNGTLVGTDGYSVHAADLIVGETYRLDVLSFNVDGSRGASDTWEIHASDIAPSQLVLAGTVTTNGGQASYIYVEILDEAGAVVQLITAGAYTDPILASAPYVSQTFAPGNYRVRAYPSVDSSSPVWNPTWGAWANGGALIVIPHPYGAVFDVAITNPYWP